MQAVKFTSPAFNHGLQIPSKYTCDGKNINPHLVIHGVPARCKYLALIMEDPDAPGGPPVHWLAWNIPPDTREIREHSAPFGAVEGINDAGGTGYTGPGPSEGTHRYFFRLFALDKRLDVPIEAAREELETAMQGRILSVTELAGTYQRTNEAPL